MTKIEKIRQIRKAVQRYINDTVTNDADMAQYSSLCDEWKPDTEYKIGRYLQYHGELYYVMSPHLSTAIYPPDSGAASLYKHIGIASDGNIIFNQPTGATDCYNTGVVVWFPDEETGRKYRSKVDNNSFSPATYPQWWELLE